MNDRANPIAIAALVVLALAVRLPGFNESLWFDELWATRVMLADFGATIRIALGDIHPPLYPILAYAWISIFGDSEISVRTIPMLSGLTTVALMPALGEALSSRRAGWLAGILLAWSPVHIWYSQEARAYALLMLLAVLTCLVWRRLDANSFRLNWFTLVALCVVAAQLHYFTIALPAALVLASALNGRHRGVALVALALSTLGIVAVLVVKARAGAVIVGSGYLRTFDAGEFVRLFLNWFAVGGAVSPGPTETSLARAAGTALIGVSGLAVIAWLGNGWRVNRRDGWVLHVLFMIAVPGLLLVMGWIGLEHYYIERSAVQALPFFLLAVSSGVLLLKADIARRLTISVTLLSSVLVLLHYYNRHDVWTVYKPNPDWRAIIDPLMRERGDPGEPLAILSTTPLAELVYYLPATAECPWPAADACGTAGSVATRLYAVPDSSARWVADVRRHELDSKTLLILNTYWPGRTPALIRNLREGGTQLRLVTRQKGLEVFAVQ